MGWAYCGKNTRTGELMGYGHAGTCHKRGCSKKIDRGLAYVCGGMHEGDIYGCGYYFCGEHLTMVFFADDEDNGRAASQLCHKCADSLEKELVKQGYVQSEDGNGWVSQETVP